MLTWMSPRTMTSHSICQVGMGLVCMDARQWECCAALLQQAFPCCLVCAASFACIEAVLVRKVAVPS